MVEPCFEVFADYCKRFGFTDDEVSDAKSVEAWIDELSLADKHGRTVPYLNANAAKLFKNIGVVGENRKVDWGKVQYYLDIAESFRQK